ncbi:MAG: DASS family sodium-coupled anion symporter [Gammaproteobacteria bacterium]|nr:DASS family sodium-coupled anion symporter [Gammaproteobacteria bacterium]NNF48340.1 DASS family sodium-coupled anion symporter [Woeseiaceae bacterium]MBT8094312.1 DASS family sodium-coupled anion symporter [Gammaproteobacteria bacterium]MBT8106005.1 DASS family sodium-coupled anion symporter [Gammaproteobacteria bacterium]NNK26019.1 DASS family sodium-coupled anion symporter [Woeseiaceae bacterium]
MILSGAPDGLSESGWMTAAVGVLMAVWWATEAVPIAVTALLPIVVFPLLGIATIQDTTAPYANKVIYLFLGGFIVAFAMQRWNLHRRIALNVLQHVGGNGRSLIGGFMLAAAVISMWVMNTSTTMMLLPIAVSIIGVIHGSVDSLDEKGRLDFQYALLLGVAYAATIGGMATLVGTAPNALLAAFMQETYGIEIDFASWMLVGLPLSALMLPLAWFVLTRIAFKVDFRTSDEGKATLRRLKEELGPISTPEIRVAIVFTLMAVTWVSRPLLVTLPGLSALDDSGIAIAGAIALFLIPSGDKSDLMLLRWTYAEKLPWGVLILFGGGLTLASAVSRTGLAEWLGGALHAVGALPVAIIVIIAAAMIIFLTELTSNIATTATFLPVVGAIAIESGIDPIVLTVPVTFAASCAFMLPVATPPNAIVFGSGMLTIPKMVRAGIMLNIVGIVVVSTIALYLAPKFL